MAATEGAASLTVLFTRAFSRENGPGGRYVFAQVHALVENVLLALHQAHPLRAVTVKALSHRWPD